MRTLEEDSGADIIEETQEVEGLTFGPGRSRRDICETNNEVGIVVDSDEEEQEDEEMMH